MTDEIIKLGANAPTIISLVAIALGAVVFIVSKAWIADVTKRVGATEIIVLNHGERMNVVEKDVAKVCIEAKEDRIKQRELENEITKSLSAMRTDLAWIKNTLSEREKS